MGHLREQSFGTTLIVNQLNENAPAAAAAAQIDGTAGSADNELGSHHVLPSSLPGPDKSIRAADRDHPINELGHSIDTAPLGPNSPANQGPGQEQDAARETSETPIRVKRSSMAVPQSSQDEVGGLELLHAVNVEENRQGMDFRGVLLPPDGACTDNLVSERGQVLPCQGADVADTLAGAAVPHPEQTGTEDWRPDGEMRLNLLPSGQAGGFSATAGMIAPEGGANHVVRIPNMDGSAPAELPQEPPQAAFGSENHPPSSAGGTQGSGTRTNLFRQLMAVKDSQMS